MKVSPHRAIFDRPRRRGNPPVGAMIGTPVVLAFCGWDGGSPTVQGSDSFDLGSPTVVGSDAIDFNATC